MRFLLAFGALATLYYFISSTPIWERLLFSHLCANASVCGAILDFLHQHTHTFQTEIVSPHFAVKIQSGCDAFEPAWHFCAGVIASPVHFVRKIPAILIGVPSLVILNFVRIISLWFVGIYWPNLLDTAHLEIWPAAFVASGIAFWVCWAHWAIRGCRSSDATQ